ncbi:uncharacterized protein P174DRAFT_429462 [Aspergillus novofumigatus IBT 16806]|uniref:Uncharacterized protein n=1 Tax=Aspergillus novofumigatus (strain IBT 16806) TaxID=1392255 RepID=A0A2I1CBL3_ASPN1|nr:uncharacterized protein P174DRAFT_429462 [Aspergillus novofumigatus IBT 16806]PKX95029.1 hypothetical protein P174DRAFT_429462 [Aspergillus novofumigatus IBT 16806]
MTSKGKDRVEVATGEEIEATSTGTDISQLLTTPEPFNMNIITDVDWEIERLETLAAEYDWLNTNPRFLTRYGVLTSQRERLAGRSTGSHHSTTQMEDEFSDTTSKLSESPQQQQQPASRKGKQQVPKKPTMSLHPSPATRNLTEDEILQIATQPPTFRSKYSRYWNSNGKIRPKFFNVIFLEKDGAFVLPELYIASNVERWQTRYHQFKHPELLNHRGSLRRRAVKARADQRDPTGQYVANEVDELNNSTRQRVVSATFYHESLLGAQTRAFPTTSASRVERAEAEAVRLAGLIHESDAYFREEVLKVERKFKKALKQKESEVDRLHRRIEVLEKENKRLNSTVIRQNRIIDRLTTDEDYYSAMSTAPSTAHSSASTIPTI